MISEVNKGVMASALFSLGSASLGKTNPHTMNTLSRRPSGKHQLASHVSEPLWKQILQTQSNLQMLIYYELMRCPESKLLSQASQGIPNTQEPWNNKRLLLFQTTVVWGNLLC